MNMVDWKYSSFFSLEYGDGTSPGDQVPGIGSGIAVELNDRRRDLFHHAPYKARCSLPRVSEYQIGRSELEGGTKSMLLVFIVFAPQWLGVVVA